MASGSSEPLTYPQTSPEPSSSRAQLAESDESRDVQTSSKDVSNVEKNSSVRAIGNAAVPGSYGRRIVSFHASANPLQNVAETAGTGTSTAETSSTGPGNAGDAPRNRKVMINRIIYFGFLVSLAAPFINFALWFPFSYEHDPPTEADKKFLSQSVGQWAFFGIFWSKLVAEHMVGPLFTLIGTFIQILNVVPALGTALCVLCSNALLAITISGVHNEGDPFIANLPLLSLIYANYHLLLPYFEDDFSSVSLYGYTQITYGVRIYTFEEGLCFGISTDERSDPYLLESCSAPYFVTESFNDLSRNANNYLSGEDLEEYQENFLKWRAHASSFRTVCKHRRLLCLTGFLFEAVAVFGSLLLLGAIDLDKPRTDKPSFAVSFSLSPIQLLIGITCCFFSDYFWMLLNVERSFTTVEEQRAYRLNRLSSRWTKWSTWASCYFANGGILRRAFWASPYKGIRAHDLSTIGIVKDNEESEAGGQTIFRSIAQSVFLKPVRLDERNVMLALYRPEVEREKLLGSGDTPVVFSHDDTIS